MGQAERQAGLRVVMMVLASIKSLQAAESISPVVAPYSERATEQLSAASELCMCVFLESVTISVNLKW